MNVKIDTALCAHLQASVDATSGETLGARISKILPKETADMRERYAGTYITALCPTLKISWPDK